MCGTQSMLAIPDGYAGTGTNEADTIQSRVFPNTGNTVMASILILNTSGTITITLKLQGSYDGVMWDDIASTTSSGGLDRKTLTGSAVNTRATGFRVGSCPCPTLPPPEFLTLPGSETPW